MQKLLLVFKHIISRWKAESPLFFKWLTNLFVTMGTIAAALMVLEQQYPTRFTWFTGIFDRLLDYMLIAGAVGAVLAKLTIKNKPIGGQES